MKKLVTIFIALTAALSLTVSCGSGNSAHDAQAGDEVPMLHARNIRIYEISPGIERVILKNPWDSTLNLADYLLVDRNIELPVDIPEGAIVVRVPLERSVVYSGVHVSLIDELGALGGIKGVCDKEYVTDSNAKAAITRGTIADCGKYTAPNVEKIISLNADAVLLSPYETSNVSAPFSKTGLSLIYTAEYMEKTPLSRAEWMRFYGRLYGKGAKADSLFQKINGNYESIKKKTAKCTNRPEVLFDRVYSGVWDVPTSGSVTGILISDAGGSNPFDRYKNPGSARLQAEEALIYGKNADIWLIRYIEPSLNLESLNSESPYYKEFEAFKKQNVYGANTLQTALFEDGAFHPDKTLREMVRLLHPEIDSSPLEYYHKVN